MQPAVPSQAFVMPPVEMELKVALPLESKVAAELGVWIVCEPPPVAKYVFVRFPDETTVTVPTPAGAQLVTPEPLVCRT